MIQDVRLSTSDRLPIEFLGRMGGEAPSVKELVAVARKLVTGAGRKKRLLEENADEHDHSFEQQQEQYQND